MANPPKRASSAPGKPAPRQSSKKPLKAPPPEPKRRSTELIGVGVILVIAIVAYFLFRPHRVTKGKVDLISPKPEATLATPTFVWYSYPGVREYELEIVTEGGDQVYATTTGDTVAQVPGDKLAAGKKYLWLVRGIVKGETQAIAHIDRFTYQP